LKIRLHVSTEYTGSKIKCLNIISRLLANGNCDLGLCYTSNDDFLFEKVNNNIRNRRVV